MVEVDREKCIGCGMCASMCPEVFELAEDGKSTIKAESCPEHDLGEIAAACPAEAIRLS
jgi:ferredoxin